MKRRVVFGALAVVMLVFAQPSSAQPNDDLTTLRKDIETLREGQGAIQKDLQEIKRLLQARPTGQAPPPQEAVLNLDGAPVKGAKAAKITLVEFTDYQ